LRGFPTGRVLRTPDIPRGGDAGVGVRASIIGKIYVPTVAEEQEVKRVG
jgi:hypothetical protein